ncbi:hypothetical protein [Phenylobacterium sp.]|uniref:hypothetical protein n=1 Tax=Phenylobacterium sp. TaxID=1871053 RepID=UPI0025F549DC|nr:hypothetical protein [Phenylobacterium sp.]MCA6264696.1 hypothetical protein [Phenylobacterium sp.]
MDLILTATAAGWALRYRENDDFTTDEIIATFPTADEAWAALKAARKATFQLRSLLNV